MILAWEWNDPELAALHFVTVTCYNLQHPAQFTESALSNLRTLFLEHMECGLAVTEIRRRVAAASSASAQVLKRPGERRPVGRAWPMTIADVALPDAPQGGRRARFVLG